MKVAEDINMKVWGAVQAGHVMFKLGEWMRLLSWKENSFDDCNLGNPMFRACEEEKESLKEAKQSVS